MPIVVPWIGIIRLAAAGRQPCALLGECGQQQRRDVFGELTIQELVAALEGLDGLLEVANRETGSR